MTRAGNFVGAPAAHGTHRFLGIRYGRARRFQPPEPVAVPGQTIAADRFGAASPQPGDKIGAQSEDCLFLNTWTPDAGASLPVMVYIHGGAYSSGSGSDPQTDGAALAARGGVVVVTLNHRLGPFGYLSLGRLDPAFPDSGNAGQLDLILALRWVRANIAAFGGDPARVMLFGQSGGGAKIATLMGTPAAAGLFRVAATMSGQQVTVSGPLHATERARMFMAAAGAATLAELAVLPVERLRAAMQLRDPFYNGGLYFGPVLDGRSLVRHPFWPDANPQSNAIPLILGNTRDETRGFFDPDSAPFATLGWDGLPDLLARELRVDIAPELVIADYRRRVPDITPADLFFAATTAARSWRGQLEEAEARARAGAPTWVYQLDLPSPLQPRRRAFHTSDIPLVFGTLGAAAGQGVSEAMMAAFAGFAHGHEPAWPRYDLATRSTMMFDTVSRIATDPRRAERELFAAVPWTQPGT